MTGKLHGIFPIGKSNKVDRKLDVIFVHGLGGDARTTWQDNDDKNLFWPGWLVEDFDDIGIWTIGYGATPTRWIEDEMAMEDRASNLLNHLSLVEGIGERPMIFITHSMGGLITKHILDQANTNPKYESLLKHLKGIVFLAVPHNGSGWADFLDAIGKIGRLNRVIEQLEKDDSGLRRLNNSFIQIVNKFSFQCLSFFETKEVRIKKKFLGTKGIMVVSESSAIGNFQQEPPIGLDNDHLSICKLQSKSDLLYLNVKKLINDHLPKDAITNDQIKDATPLKLQISKLPHTNSRLFGREEELAMLDKAWNDQQTNVLVLKAFGGSGKTALMQKWLNNLAEDHFRGADAVYTWSFYSQGSAEDKQASADEFLDAALAWFGYKGDPFTSPHSKGLKLSELVNLQRTLLVLDGLEPVQYPEGGAMDGALRDAGLKTLLQQLSVQNKGLLLISSRQFITELNGKAESLVTQNKLQPLSVSAGIELFKDTHIKGTDKELEEAIREVNGHALSLNLLAKYLSTYEDSDIRQRHNLPALVDFPEETRDSRHAYTVMAAYENQLKDTVDIKILFMMGLFDRPISGGAINALRKSDIEQISDMVGETVTNNKVFKAAIERLRMQDLLNKQNPEYPENLDTHPLVREYFNKRLRIQYPTEYQQAHAELYDYFKALPEKKLPDSIHEMEPLFAAITHGCAAGLYEKTLYEVLHSRIMRDSSTNYYCQEFGAFGIFLSALSHFFVASKTFSWKTPVPELNDNAKAAILSWTSFSLQALGRLQEAVQPMQKALEIQIKTKDWRNAASAAATLSELQLTRGVISQVSIDQKCQSALEIAKQAVELADKSRDLFERMMALYPLGKAQHYAGDFDEAHKAFEKAEYLQKERQPRLIKLYSVQGYCYCDLLLMEGNWKEVLQRAKYALKISEDGVFNDMGLFDIALDKLSLGRANLQQSITKVGLIEHSSSKIPLDNLIILPIHTGKITLDTTIFDDLVASGGFIVEAVDGLRKAGHEWYLPQGLLANASLHRWLLWLDPHERNFEIPLQNLKEIHDIAVRGEMPLYLCDYHLEAARLIMSFDFSQKPLGLSAREHVEKAKQIIVETNYKRRLPEQEYLEKIIADS